MPNPFFGPGERRLFDDCCRRIYHYLKHRHPGEFLKWEEPSHRQGVVADSHPIRSGLEHLGDSVLSDAASFLFEYLCPGKEALYKVLKAALTCNCVLGYLMYFLGYHDLTADKIGGDTWETFLGSLLLSLPYSNVIEWALPVLEPLAIVCLEVLDPDFKYTSSGPPALQQVPLSCVDTPVPVGDATTDEAAEELGPLLEYLAAFKTPCTLIAPDRAIPSCMTSFPPTTGQQEPSVLNALGSGAQATCPPAQEVSIVHYTLHQPPPDLVSFPVSPRRPAPRHGHVLVPFPPAQRPPQAPPSLPRVPRQPPRLADISAPSLVSRLDSRAPMKVAGPPSSAEGKENRRLNNRLPRNPAIRRRSDAARAPSLRDPRRAPYQRPAPRCDTEDRHVGSRQWRYADAAKNKPHHDVRRLGDYEGR